MTNIHHLEAREGISALLAALGFEAMARDVKSEQDPERINRYASLVVKNTRDESIKGSVIARFNQLGIRWNIKH